MTGHVGVARPEERAREGRAVRGYVWIAISAVTCPCHVPLLIALFGGGALGGALSRHSGVIAVALAGIFGLAVWRGLGALRSQREV